MYNKCFKSPYVCEDCTNKKENYVNDDDAELMMSNDNIIYVNALGRKFIMNQDTELSVYIETPNGVESSVSYVNTNAENREYEAMNLIKTTIEILQSQLQLIREEIKDKNILIKMLCQQNTHHRASSSIETTPTPTINLSDTSNISGGKYESFVNTEDNNYNITMETHKRIVDYTISHLNDSQSCNDFNDRFMRSTPIMFNTVSNTISNTHIQSTEISENTGYMENASTLENEQKVNTNVLHGKNTCLEQRQRLSAKWGTKEKDLERTKMVLKNLYP